MIKFIPWTFLALWVIIAHSFLLIQTRLIPIQITIITLAITSLILVILMIYAYQKNSLSKLGKLVVIICLAVTCLIWSVMWANYQANKVIESNQLYIDSTVTVQGSVKTLHFMRSPDEEKEQAKLIQFMLFKIDHKTIPPRIILLTGKSINEVKEGEIWEFKVTLKAIHAPLNEDSFDLQRFYLSKGIMLTGKVHSGVKIDQSISLRQEIATIFEAVLSSSMHKGLILSLTFGDKQLLSNEIKTLLFKTGIAHLLAISGMHIMLVYVLFHFVFKYSQFIMCQRYVSYGFPIVAGYLFALMYAWLTGLSPPTLRAILALSIWIMLKFLNRNLTSWQMIIRIMAILLLYDPLMVLSESFWLSCYAVLSLVFIVHWFPFNTLKRPKLYAYFIQLSYLQLLLTICLLPLQIYLFNGASVTSILANLIAIPLVSLILMPLIFILLGLSLLNLTYLSHLIVKLIDYGFDGLLFMLTYLDGFWISIPFYYLGLSLCLLLMLIYHRFCLFKRYHFTLILVFLFSLTPFFNNKRDDEVRIDLFDVGHGLSVLITKNGHSIMYDTAASGKYRTLAEQHIIPYLKSNQLVLDGIIISHEHDDHQGGLTSLSQVYPNAWLMSSSKSLPNTFNCTTDTALYWQGIKLAVLWPPNLNDEAFNDSSCVVKIHFYEDNLSLLLTGDLEREQELELVKKYQNELNSTLLQVPHHGSRTSSSYAFLAQVQPELSLLSTARYNPWNLPNQAVLNRYEELSLPYLNTSDTGQITIHLYKGNWTVRRLRFEINPKWYHDAFGSFTKKR